MPTSKHSKQKYYKIYPTAQWEVTDELSPVPTIGTRLVAHARWLTD